MPPKSNKLLNSAERHHSFEKSIAIGGESIRWSDNNSSNIIESLVFYGFYYTPTEVDLHRITCAYCLGTESVNIDTDITTVLEDHDKHHHECYVSLAYVANTIHQQPIDFIVDYYTNQSKHISSPLLKSAFKFRLKFYDKKYIHDKIANISSKSLAEAGFIYNKSSRDEVICLYCGCSFTDWEENDDPFELHQTSNDNRYCYFLDKKGVKRNNEKLVDDMSVENLSDASIQLEGIDQNEQVINVNTQGDQDMQAEQVHLDDIDSEHENSNNSKFKSPKAASRATSLTPKVDPNDAYWDKPPDESLFDDLISVAKSPRLLSNKESFRELALSKATRLEQIENISEDMQRDFSDFLDDPVDAEESKTTPATVDQADVEKIASPISADGVLEINTKGLSELQVESESVVGKGKGKGKRKGKSKVAKNKKSTEKEVGPILSQPDMIEIRPRSRRNRNRKLKIADSQDDSPAEKISNILTKEPSVDIISELKSANRRKKSIEPHPNTSIDVAEKITTLNDKSKAHTTTEIIEIPDTETNANKGNSNRRQPNKKGEGAEVENSGIEKGIDQTKEIEAKQNGKPGKRARKIKFKARQAPVFDTSTHDINDYGDTNLVALEENINLNPTSFDLKNTSLDSDVIMRDEVISPIRLKSNEVSWKNRKNRKNETIKKRSDSPIISIFDKSLDDLVLEKISSPLKLPAKADTTNKSQSPTIRSNAMRVEPIRRETRTRKSKQIATSKIAKDFLENIVNLDLESDDRHMEPGSEDETGNNTKKTPTSHLPPNLKPQEQTLDNYFTSDHDASQVQAARGSELELEASDSEASHEVTVSKSNISGFVSNNSNAVEESSDIDAYPSSMIDDSLSEKEATADDLDDYADYLNTVKQMSANYLPNKDTLHLRSSSEISDAASLEDILAVQSDSEKDMNLMDSAFKSTNEKVDSIEIQTVSPEEKQTDDKTNIEQLGDFNDSDDLDHFVSDVEGDSMEEDAMEVDAMEVFDSNANIIDKPKPAINTKENRNSESDQIDDGFEVDHDVELPLDKANNIDSDPIEAISDDADKMNEPNSPIIDNNRDIEKDIDNDDKVSRGTLVESTTSSEEIEDQGPETHNSSGSELNSDNESEVGMIEDRIEEVEKVKEEDEGTRREENAGNTVAETSKIKDLEIVHPRNFIETKQSAITPQKSVDINRGSLQNSRVSNSSNISKIPATRAIPSNRKHPRSSHELPSFEPRTSIQVEGDNYSPIKAENFKILDSSTPSKDREEKPLSKPSFDPVGKLFTQKQLQMKQSSEYLKSIINYEYELHNDIESELTNFIANMPSEEADMTVMEWVKYGAANCRRLIMEDYDLLNKMYKEEYLKKLKELEDLPTID